jgi:hypothetical protein
MKVIVEFDLPEGQAIPDPRDIVRLTSPDWHCDWWHISDVQSVAEDLTDDDAREVLRYMNKYSDCNVGINWETIEVWADIVRKERPPVECECCHEEFDAEDMLKYQGKMVCGDCEIDLKEKENA